MAVMAVVRAGRNDQVEPLGYAEADQLMCDASSGTGEIVVPADVVCRRREEELESDARARLAKLGLATLTLSRSTARHREVDHAMAGIVQRDQNGG
jgi:hypothetical protein